MTDDSAAAPVMPARGMLTLLGVLAALPLIPFGVLAARDWVYAQLHLVNNETPQGTVTAWELWVVAAVCWGTALVVAAVWGTRRRRA